MPNNLAIPQCFVDVYPFEGGNYTIQGAMLLNCQVNKNIRQDSGTFSITLAPGGPAGEDIGPSWSEIITPNSLVIIGMSRWQYRQIVMVGIVTKPAESQAWRPDSPVIRTISISGQDFSYYFTSQSYFAWNFLASTFAAVLAPQLNENAAALPFVLGILQGTPATVGSQWFNRIFAGNQGLLASTVFPYRNARISFPNAIAQWFQEYPNFVIPMSDYFIATEESWIAKFRKIFPFPFYETFVTTAQPGFYPSALGGYGFSCKGLGDDIQATPVFVARINPLPRVTVDTSGSAPAFSSMDVAAWNALKLFMPDANFYESQLAFSTDEARNFYAIIPTWYATLYGGSASSTSALLFLGAGAVDITSIHRYGYRPAWQSTAWFADPTGGFAQSGNINVTALVWDLMTRVYSYYEPTPLMGYAATVIQLRPDIMPGCRYRYQPLKNEDSWDFYIEGVIHNFKFGGPSTTTLTLTRGLPSALYADASDSSIQRAITLGKAQRVNGVYQASLPQIVTQVNTIATSTNQAVSGSVSAVSLSTQEIEPGLQILPFNSPSALNAIQAQAAQVFVSPQTQ